MTYRDSELDFAPVPVLDGLELEPRLSTPPPAAADADTPASLEPPLGSPLWPGYAAPVLAYLAEPRDWYDLEAWAKSRGLHGYRLRNALAYLEAEGLAHTSLVRVGGRKQVRWHHGPPPPAKGPASASASAPAATLVCGLCARAPVCPKYPSSGLCQRCYKRLQKRSWAARKRGEVLR